MIKRENRSRQPKPGMIQAVFRKMTVSAGMAGAGFLLLAGLPLGPLAAPMAQAAVTFNIASASTAGTTGLVGGAAGVDVFVDTNGGSGGSANFQNQDLFALLCTSTSGGTTGSPCTGTQYAGTLTSSTGGTCLPNVGGKDISTTARCKFTVPDAPAAGSPGTTYTLIVTEGSHPAETSFTVLTPSLGSTTSAPPGSSVSLTTSNFAPEALDVTSSAGSGTDFSSSCTPTSAVTTISASSYLGTSATCSFHAPVTGTTSNPVTITVSDGANSATTSFTVATPSLAITNSTASSGPVGSTVSLTGTSFRVSQPIAVVSSGADFTAGSSFTSGRCRTDSSGSFTCTLVQSVASPGAATITVADGANSASTTFTVLGPTISLAAGSGGSSCTNNACSGSVGSTINVTGSDFALGSTVFVSLAGVSATCTADSSTGALPASGTCAVTIPGAASGANNVTASDGDNTATVDSSANTATFTITSSISATPTSAAAGSNVVTSGTGFAASTPITIQLGGTTVSTGCTSGTDGSFSCSFTVPVLPSGSQSLQVSDGTNNNITLSGGGGFTVQTGAPVNAPTSMLVKSVVPAFGPSTGGTKKNPTTTVPSTGTAVTNAISINGSGFQSAKQVFFGSTAATIVSINPPGTVIKVIPPAGSGAVQVQVAGSTGNSDVSTAASLYFSGPTVSGLAPNFGSVATAAKTVTIHGHNLTGLSGITFVPAASPPQPATPTGVTFVQCSALAVDTCWKATIPLQTGLAGAYYVRLTGPGGVSDISSQQSLFSGELYSFGPLVSSISPTFGSASGGNKLTITGHGFAGATAVNVGGKTINSGFMVTGDTTITVAAASMPSQLGTDPAQVNVVVVGKNGDLSPTVPKDLYSYGPLVTGVTPQSGGPGALTKLTITGKNFLGATQVNFGTIAVSSGSFTVNGTGTGITLTSVPALPSGQNPGPRYITVQGATGGATNTSAINTKAVFNIL